jgi:hypothetical protein
MSGSTHTPLRRASLLLLAAVSALVVQVAGAAQNSATLEGPKKPSSTSVKFIEAPSSERPAAREKRLKRECRGRPNAGMCLGHTR